MQTLQEDVYEIDGQTRVDEVNELLGTDLPTAPHYETIAGFLLFQWRRIPKVGDYLLYEKPGLERGFRITVAKMEGPKIERVKVERV